MSLPLCVLSILLLKLITFSICASLFQEMTGRKHKHRLRHQHRHQCDCVKQWQRIKIIEFSEFWAPNNRKFSTWNENFPSMNLISIGPPKLEAAHVHLAALPVVNSYASFASRTLQHAKRFSGPRTRSCFPVSTHFRSLLGQLFFPSFGLFADKLNWSVRDSLFV